MFYSRVIAIRIGFVDMIPERDKTKRHPPVKHRFQQLIFNALSRQPSHQPQRGAAHQSQRRMTAGDQLPCRAVHRPAHLVFTQPPTSMIVEITATSMTPSRTVYSTSVAPASSRASRFSNCNIWRVTFVLPSLLRPAVSPGETAG